MPGASSSVSVPTRRCGRHEGKCAGRSSRRVFDVNERHSDVAAELWSLAETVLTRLEPVLRQAVEEQSERPKQGCSWCPVCALAALLRGEQHDLLTLLASEGATVLALLRQIMAEHAGGPAPGGGYAGARDTAASSAEDISGDMPHGEDSTVGHDTEDPIVRRAKFVPITVTLKDAATEKPGN
jgi:hypothetical protein